MNRASLVICSLVLSACASAPYYDNRPSAPANISPEAAVDIVAGTDTEFVWDAAQRVSYYEFHLFNNTNADIQQYYMRNLEPSQVCAASRCSLRVKVDLPVATRHAWRVRAVNNAGASVWTRTIFNIVAP